MTNKNLLIIIAVLFLGVVIAIAMDIPGGITEDSEARQFVSSSEDLKG